MANTLAHGCPRDHADLRYDVERNFYTCTMPGCDYTQKGLHPDPKDLVIAPALVPSTRLAEEMGLSQSALESRARGRGITPCKDAYGHNAFTQEEVRVLRAWTPKVRPDERRFSPVEVALAPAVNGQPPPAALVVPPSETLAAPIALSAAEERTFDLARGITITLHLRDPWLSLSTVDRRFAYELAAWLEKQQAARLGSRANRSTTIEGGDA